MRPRQRGGRRGFSSGYWIVSRGLKVCLRISHMLPSAVKMGNCTGSSLCRLYPPPARATTTAPVTARFARATGSMTFHPYAMSWS